MVKYPVEVGKEEAKAAGIGLPISTKNTVLICRKINKMELSKAKRFLREMVERRRSIKGRYYDKTCSGIIEILESAEKNAEYKGIENPIIKTISVEKGPIRRRMKRRRSFGSFLKNTNIKIILKKGKKKGGKDEHKK